MMNIQDQINDLKITLKQKEVLNSLNIFTVNDLLCKYPRTYQIIKESLDPDNLCLEATIDSKPVISFYNGRNNRIVFNALIKNKSIKVVIFNRYFLFNNLKKSFKKTIVIKGKYQNNNIIASDIFLDNLANISGITALYNLKGLYNNKSYLKLLGKIMNQYAEDIMNYIPEQYIKKYQLLDRKAALQQIHFPTSSHELSLAQQTLIYEELFLFSLSVLIKRHQDLNAKYAKKIVISAVQAFVAQIAYQLTNDQKRVVNEIYQDLSSTHLMNRILIADVGSGKTLVALLAAFMSIKAGYQVAFMAPTTILAAQHYQSALALFANTTINIGYLTGNIAVNERMGLLEKLKHNEIDLLIGTHALYQDDVVFKHLGLVVFDEQQKFGVTQRLKLLRKSKYCESLMLSATPIPRTLAQIMFADISVSYMHQLLPFKKPVITYYFKSKTIKPYYPEMIKLLEAKQQIYIVAPLIEESEKHDLINVINLHKNIAQTFKGKYSVGLLHGKLSTTDKEQIMNDFNNHDYDILVATSLLEVGISVDNATCIIIYDAERFGLSQLHQLRGRVGRKDLQGYCVLLSNSADETVIDKLNFVKNNNDGFKIAEYDLMLRGSGDILGTRQTGLPNFKIANLSRHKKILEQAFKDAQEFMTSANFKAWLDLNKNILDIDVND